MHKNDNVLKPGHRSIIQLSEYRSAPSRRSVKPTKTEPAAPVEEPTPKGNAIMAAMAVFFCTYVVCILYGLIN